MRLRSPSRAQALERGQIRRHSPRAIDLFAGAGGLSEGLRRAGYRVIGAVEVDSHACATYRLNHAGVHLWQRDIRELSGAAMMRQLKIRRGSLELLAACPPCQGFSTMRTRNGARRNYDPRNELIFEVLRLTRSMRPKAVMLENVPGLATNWRIREFRRQLEAIGYSVNVGVFDAVDYGVPQHRKRLVLAASLGGKPTFARSSQVRRVVRDAIGGLPSSASSRDPIHNYSVRHSEKVKAIIRRIPRNGGSRRSLDEAEQLACHRRVDGFGDVYGRMHWARPSPTITSGCINPSKGRFLHPVLNRSITLREAALIQTFPRNYQFDWGTGRYAVALLIGNALPPEFIRRHALAIRKSTLNPIAR